MLADANFPAASVASHGPRLLRADGSGNVELLAAILQLLPLDEYVPSPAAVMQKTDKDKDLPVPIVAHFQATLDAAHGCGGGGPRSFGPTFEEIGEAPFTEPFLRLLFFLDMICGTS